MTADHEDYQLNIPKKSSLKKFKTNIKVNIEEEEENEILLLRGGMKMKMEN